MFCPSCGKEIPDHSQFCLTCGSAIVATPSMGTEAVASVEGKDKRRRRPWRALVIVVICLIGGIVLGREASRVTRMLRSPRSEALASGPVVVQAGHVRYFKFEVDTDRMKDVHVAGIFRTSGGLGNDIQAVIAGETDFQNWMNGHKARLLYGTERVTAGEIDTPIVTSGTYYFAISNRFSLISDKTVEAYVSLKYKSY